MLGVGSTRRRREAIGGAAGRERVARVDADMLACGCGAVGTTKAERKAWEETVSKDVWKSPSPRYANVVHNLSLIFRARLVINDLEIDPFKSLLLRGCLNVHNN